MKIVHGLAVADIAALQNQCAEEYPVYMSTLTKVEFDKKLNVHTASFETNYKKVTLKVADHVVDFMLQQLNNRGSWYIKTEAGAITDCIFYSYD